MGPRCPWYQLPGHLRRPLIRRVDGTAAGSPRDYRKHSRRPPAFHPIGIHSPTPARNRSSVAHSDTPTRSHGRSAFTLTRWIPVGDRGLQVVARHHLQLRIMASSHVPSPDQYPRRGDGRKGAHRRRHAMAPAPTLPRHHNEHRGQDRQGNGAGAGWGWDTFRSLNTPRPPHTTTNNRRLRLRKHQATGTIHEQSPPRSKSSGLGRRSLGRRSSTPRRRSQWRLAASRCDGAKRHH
jgi:hypothetical protein